MFAETGIHSLLFRYFVKTRPDVTKHVVENQIEISEHLPRSLDNGIIFNYTLFFLTPVKI